MQIQMNSNVVIANLPEQERLRWLPQLERVELQQDEVLQEAGTIDGHFYFPSTAILSVMRQGDAGMAQLALVGHDGVVGHMPFLGDATAPYRVVVQVPGDAFRLPVDFVTSEVKRSHEVMLSMLRYSQALVAQMAQTALCGWVHTPDQQMARWLLHSLDYSPEGQISFSQEIIANMLGVSVDRSSQVVKNLSEAGALLQQGGHITVADRAALEARACSCYQRVVHECSHALPSATLTDGP